MKKAVAALALVLLGAAGALGFAGQWALAALGLVAAVAIVAFASMRGAQAALGDPILEDLHPSDQARLSPLRRHRNAIRDLVEAKRSEPAIAVVGAEALGEADHILVQAVKMLQLRRELLRSVAGRTEAGNDLADLDRSIAEAASEAEREALRSAQEARRLELAHYDRAEEAKERIETSLRQAEAALGELKARLTTAAAGSSDVGETDDLRATVGRLKTLGTSLDEAEAWLKG